MIQASKLEINLILFRTLFDMVTCLPPAQNSAGTVTGSFSHSGDTSFSSAASSLTSGAALTAARVAALAPAVNPLADASIRRAQQPSPMFVRTLELTRPCRSPAASVNEQDSAKSLADNTTSPSPRPSGSALTPRMSASTPRRSSSTTPRLARPNSGGDTSGNHQLEESAARDTSSVGSDEVLHKVPSLSSTGRITSGGNVLFSFPMNSKFVSTEGALMIVLLLPHTCPSNQRLILQHLCAVLDGNPFNKRALCRANVTSILLRLLPKFSEEVQ